MSLEVVINFPTPAGAAVAPVQTPAAAGPLILVTNIGNFPVPPVIFPRFQTTISLTSTGDASAATYTLVGQDVYGHAVTELLAGPNATTVSSVNQYHQLYSISVNNAGVGVQISAGVIPPDTSMWITMDHFRPMAQTSVRATIVSGAATYTINQTLDDPIQVIGAGGTPDTFSLDAPAVTFVGATTSKFFYLPSPVGGIQAMRTAPNTGNLRVSVLQQGVRA